MISQHSLAVCPLCLDACTLAAQLAAQTAWASAALEDNNAASVDARLEAHMNIASAVGTAPGMAELDRFVVWASCASVAVRAAAVQWWAVVRP